MNNKPLIDYTDAELLHRLFIEELGFTKDEESNDYLDSVDDGSIAGAVQHFSPDVLTDLNAINALELALVSRRENKRRVFRERLECLCGDTILHASARKRTLALIKTLEVLRLNPSA